MVPSRGLPVRSPVCHSRTAHHLTERNISRDHSAIHRVSSQKRHAQTVERVAQLPKRLHSTEIHSSRSVMIGHAPSCPALPGEPGYELIEKNMRHYQRTGRHFLLSEEDAERIKAKRIKADKKPVEDDVVFAPHQATHPANAMKRPATPSASTAASTTPSYSRPCFTRAIKPLSQKALALIIKDSVDIFYAGGIMLPARGASGRITLMRAATSHVWHQPHSRPNRIYQEAGHRAQRIEHLSKRWSSSNSRGSVLDGHAPSTPPLPGEPGYPLIEKRLRQLSVELERQHHLPSKSSLDYQALRQLAIEFFGINDPKEFQQLPADIRQIKNSLADLQARLAAGQK